MKKYPILMANGTQYLPPLFDPIVARHYGEGSSMIETLMNEINVKEIYAPLFEGKKDLVFLDIGANIGLVSIYAADACKRIVSLEPAPATFEVLKAMTLSLSNIEPLQFALAPEDGPCEMFINEQNTTASSTVNTYGRLTEVQGLTLGSILSQNQLEKVDICKADCEGAEGESFTFDQLDAARNIIDCYWIEFHNCPKSTWTGKVAEVLARLLLFGYSKNEISGMRLIARK